MARTIGKQPILLAVTAILLASCGLAKAPVKPVYTFYDECEGSNPAFKAMISCGKLTRTAYCQANNTCTPGGNAFVQYADSLVMSVDNREMTEADARRKLAELKLTTINELQRNIATISAGEAARPAAGPQTCIRSGNVVNCF